MNYDFIEIGTADFRTLAEVPDLIGISIEPVKEYFDRLPDRKGLTKINAAVSDKEGTGIMYYYKREDIERLGMPLWFKGCHSLNYKRDDLVQYLPAGVKHEDVLSKQECPIITLDKLFHEHVVESVDFLKIDTEGHDYQIMQALYDVHVLHDELPVIKKIQYESNYLMEPEKDQQIIDIFKGLGYKAEHVVSKGNKDTILTLQ